MKVIAKPSLNTIRLRDIPVGSTYRMEGEIRVKMKGSEKSMPNQQYEIDLILGTVMPIGSQDVYVVLCKGAFVEGQE